MATVTWHPGEPLDLARAMARHNRWGADPVNLFDEHGYWRVTAAGVPYRAVQPPDGTVTVLSPDPESALADLRYRLADHLSRRPAEELAARDGRVAGLLARFDGYRPPLVPDPFEMVVTSICAQQVNLAWATTTRARLVHAYAHPVPFDGRRLWPFPEAAALASADPQELRDLQFTWAKARSIVGVARHASNGGFAGLAEQADSDVIARLTALKGVGRWTADWFLARGLGRPDAVAAGDLGVRKAVGLIYLGGEAPASEGRVRELAAGWGPAANWTAHLLLEALSAG